ncbi:MAG: hypothetical protein AAFQ65_15845, partial [Myxococcota bacterium]
MRFIEQHSSDPEWSGPRDKGLNYMFARPGFGLGDTTRGSLFLHFYGDALSAVEAAYRKEPDGWTDSFNCEGDQRQTWRTLKEIVTCVDHFEASVLCGTMIDEATKRPGFTGAVPSMNEPADWYAYHRGRLAALEDPETRVNPTRIHIWNHAYQSVALREVPNSFKGGYGGQRWVVENPKVWREVRTDIMELLADDRWPLAEYPFGEAGQMLQQIRSMSNVGTAAEASARTPDDQAAELAPWLDVQPIALAPWKVRESPRVTAFTRAPSYEATAIELESVERAFLSQWRKPRSERWKKFARSTNARIDGPRSFPNHGTIVGDTTEGSFFWAHYGDMIQEAARLELEQPGEAAQRFDVGELTEALLAVEHYENRIAFAVVTEHATDRKTADAWRERERARSDSFPTTVLELHRDVQQDTRLIGAYQSAPPACVGRWRRDPGVSDHSWRDYPPGYSRPAKPQPRWTVSNADSWVRLRSSLRTLIDDDADLQAIVDFDVPAPSDALRGLAKRRERASSKRARERERLARKEAREARIAAIARDNAQIDEAMHQDLPLWGRLQTDVGQLRYLALLSHEDLVGPHPLLLADLLPEARSERVTKRIHAIEEEGSTSAADDERLSVSEWSKLSSPEEQIGTLSRVDLHRGSRPATRMDLLGSTKHREVERMLVRYEPFERPRFAEDLVIAGEPELLTITLVGEVDAALISHPGSRGGRGGALVGAAMVDGRVSEKRIEFAPESRAAFEELFHEERDSNEPRLVVVSNWIELFLMLIGEDSPLIAAGALSERVEGALQFWFVDQRTSTGRVITLVPELSQDEFFSPDSALSGEDKRARRDAPKIRAIERSAVQIWTTSDQALLEESGYGPDAVRLLAPQATTLRERLLRNKEAVFVCANRPEWLPQDRAWVSPLSSAESNTLLEWSVTKDSRFDHRRQVEVLMSDGGNEPLSEAGYRDLLIQRAFARSALSLLNSGARHVVVLGVEPQ